MHKFLAVLSIVGLVIMASDSVGTITPEDAVAGFFNALKSGDFDAMRQYVIEEDQVEVELAMAWLTTNYIETAEGMVSLISVMEFRDQRIQSRGRKCYRNIRYDFHGTKPSGNRVSSDNGRWKLVNNI